MSSRQDRPPEVVVRDRLSEGLTRDRLALEVRRARWPFSIYLALLAAGIVSIVILFAKLDVPWPWQHRYEVHIAVPDAKGVVPGADEMRIAGVAVGHITAVGIRGNQAVLTVAIDRSAGPLYRDARLRLRPKTPLDDMYLNVVSRGTPAAGRVPNGGTIAADRTQAPVDIGRVLDVYSASVRPRVRAAIDGLGEGLADHGAQFRAALVRLAPFLDAARRLTRENAIRQVETRRLVHNFQLMTGELARRDRQVAGLVRSGSSTFQELAAAGVPLGQLINQLPPTLRIMPGTFASLRATADELDPTFSALMPVARALPSGLSALRRVSRPATPALRGLDRSLPQLTTLLGNATPLATQLASAFRTLQPQTSRLDRVTAAIQPCEAAVGKFFQWSLSVTKFADIHGVFPRGQDVAGVQTAAGNAADPGLVQGASCSKTRPRK